MARRASVRRKTGETDVSASASLDGSGKASVSTGIRFVDHLLGSLAKHSMMDLTVKASSLDGISHHLIEDAGISIGQAIDKALGARTGIARFGHASVPLDESLSEATVDLVRRPYCKISLSLKRSSIEGVPREDLEHLFSSLLFNTSSCIHVAVKYGDNDHHKVESAIKSVAVALRQAASRDPRQKGSPSTKGKMVA